MPNLKTFDINLLVTFDVLMAERHVTRAAKRIGVTQPAMTNALNRLRAAFDDELLVRAPGGMVPTPWAQRHVGLVRDILRGVEALLDGERAFDPRTSARTFRVRMSDLLAAILLPALHGALRARAPHCRLEIVSLPPGAIVQALEDGECDLALSMGIDHGNSIRACDLGDTREELESRLGIVTGLLDREGRAGGRRGFTIAREASAGEGADPTASREAAARAFGAGAQGSQRLAEDGDEAAGDGVRLAPPEAVDAVTRIWGMRKRAVGLLGNMRGDARPIAFVEDTAVPPEHLADYIAEFRAALDRRGLVYGMFGHVDAGVLHVRPAIDMKAPGAETLIREVTEEVLALTAKYGGLLWGEHGKGVRSEFVPAVFGPLYPALQRIKAAFDPRDQMNPGKIAAPDGARLLAVDGVPTKGQADRAIPAAVRAKYNEALHCNGNGACFNYDPDDAMCPSWKGTRERRHSPKGRAQLMREWLRLLAVQGCDPVAEADRRRRAGGWTAFPARLAATLSRRPDFSHAVKESMDGCLACKSCVGQCPIKVNVPGFRAKFLELYHGRYLRRPRDHAVGLIERLLPLAARLPRLANAVTGSGPGEVLARAVGLTATPRLSGIDLVREAERHGVAVASPAALRAVPDAERGRSVVVVQDAFTTHYEAPLVLALRDLLTELGFKPWLAPFRPNGKPLHVHGFLGRFARQARANAAMLRDLSTTGVDLVGLDPSMTLTYRAEYAEALGVDETPRVHLVQEWLAGRLVDRPPAGVRAEFMLLPHCTEQTTAAASLRD